jgi:chromosomal replication initiator protein
VNIQTIQAAVCRHFRVTHLDLVSRRRGRGIVRPRQVGMWLARHLTVASLPEIGRAFGGRDHTTVMHALGVVERLMLQDAYWRNAVWTIVDSVDERGTVALRRAMMKVVA